jgi:hypothetical protein
MMAVTILLLGALANGCVRRRLMVRTNQPGALVAVDNQVIGTTPVATSFRYYGTREIRIERDGFRTEKLVQSFRPPWYQWPVIDFFAETLYPGELRDERVVDVELVPQTLPTVDQVISTGDQLRAQARSGVITNVAPATTSAPAGAMPLQGLPTGGISATTNPGTNP